MVCPGFLLYFCFFLECKENLKGNLKVIEFNHPPNSIIPPKMSPMHCYPTFAGDEELITSQEHPVFDRSTLFKVPHYLKLKSGSLWLPVIGTTRGPLNICRQLSCACRFLFKFIAPSSFSSSSFDTLSLFSSELCCCFS